MIKFSNKIQDKLSSIQLGILTFKANVTPSNKSFWSIVNMESKNIRSTIKPEDITRIPVITSTRLGYKQCGKDPSRYRPSADSLIRRIVKGNELYKVNNIVDTLNLVSLRSGYSIGGYDREKVGEIILLDIGSDKDRYFGIGRGELNIEGLPVLRDNEGAFGSPTSDSERTMVSEESEKIVFVFFDFGLHSELDYWMQETVILLKKYCEARDFSKQIVKL